MGLVLGLGKGEKGSLGLVYKLGKRKKRFFGVRFRFGKRTKKNLHGVNIRFEKSRNRFLELRKGETGFWGLVVAG